MEFHIEKYRKGQEKEIHQLIKKVYDEFVSVDYSDEGNRFFYDWINPSRIAERQKQQNNILLAIIDTGLAGMIEIRDGRFISLLFVDKEYHGQGIAKKLVEEALKECLARDAKIETVFVHASPFSIPVYEKLGFEASGEMKEEHGIKYLPMKMELKAFFDPTKQKEG
jgi:GNAT superfamily N-acetyltransferase